MHINSSRSQPGNGGAGFTRLRDFGAFQTITPPPLTNHADPITPIPLAEPGNLWQAPGRPSRTSGRIGKSWPGRISAHLQKRRLRLSLQIVVTCVLLFLLSLTVSWPTVFRGLGQLHKSMALVALVIGAGGIVLSAYQWRSLLRTVQLHFDLADLIDLYIIGIAFNHILPTGIGGDAIKALALGKSEGERLRSTGAILLCRLTGFLAMLLIALPTLYLWQHQLDGTLWRWSVLLLCLAIILVVSLLLVLIFFEHFLKYLPHFAFLQSLARTSLALRSLFWQPPALLRAIGYGWIFWWVAILNCYCYAQALGLAIPFYFFLIAVPFVSLVSMLPLSFNGFGLREGAFVLAFTGIHVSPAHALLLALLFDLQAFCFALVGLCLYAAGKRKKISLAALP